MTPPGTPTAEQQRLEQQQRIIELAVSGKRRWRPTGQRVLSVAEPQVILTAHKRNKRFESPVSVSALREALYQMERYGWTVVFGEEHAAPARGGRGRPSPSRPSVSGRAA